MYQVSQSSIDELAQNGAICLRKITTDDWVKRLQDTVDEMLVQKRAGNEGAFDILNGAYDRNQVIKEFVHQSDEGEIARQLLQSKEARFFFDQTFVKEPGTDAPTPWHHDQSFWPVKGKNVMSIWLALDYVTKESSGLEYIKGSHLWNKRFRPEGFTEESKKFFEGTDGEDIPDIDNNRDKYEFLNWDLEPGDCLIHMGFAVHGSSGNATRDRRRRAFATRWLGDGIIYAPEQTKSTNLIDSNLKSGDGLENSRYPIIAKI